MWEDPANADGGKWVLTMKNNPALLDRCWSWLAMALVGEELEGGDDICGAVVSLRTKVDRIQLWTRNKDDLEKLNAIAKKLVKLLDISEADNIGLEFQVSHCSLQVFLLLTGLSVQQRRSSPSEQIFVYPSCSGKFVPIIVPRTPFSGTFSCQCNWWRRFRVFWYWYGHWAASLEVLRLEAFIKYIFELTVVYASFTDACFIQSISLSISLNKKDHQCAWPMRRACLIMNFSNDDIAVSVRETRPGLS